MTSASSDKTTTKQSTKKIPFQERHKLQYGVKISGRDNETKEVKHATCRFCCTFGKLVSSRKRKRKGTQEKRQDEDSGKEEEGKEDYNENKRRIFGRHWVFSEPFKTAKYKSHLQNCHPKEWKKYQSLSDEEKRIFFEVERALIDSKTKQSKMTKFVSTSPRAVLDFDIDFVDNLVKFFLDPAVLENDDLSDPEKTAVDKALKYFVRTKSGREPDTREHYVVNIRNTLQKAMVIDAISIGLSFRQAERLHSKWKGRLDNGDMGALSRDLVAHYVRLGCLENLLAVRDILVDQVSTFSMALDLATHNASHYLDFRVRFLLHDRIWNYHVAAMPMHERHTAENVFNRFVAMFDVLCPDWRRKLLSVSTDGESKMTGRIKGVATRIERECGEHFIRIWCAAHQLDLVVKECYNSIDSETFYSNLSVLLAYLRRQQNWVQSVGSRPPRVIETRWLSMGSVTKWIWDHIDEVVALLDDEKPKAAPPDSFWVTLGFVHSISQESLATFRKMQGCKTILSQQDVYLQELAETFKSLYDIREMSEAVTWEMEPHLYIISKAEKYWITKVNVESMISLFGSMFFRIFHRLVQEEKDRVVYEIGYAICTLVEGIEGVRAERTSTNESAKRLENLLPKGLVQLPASGLYELLDKHQSRMSISTPKRRQIEQDFRSLILKYSKKQGETYDLVESTKNDDGYESAWNRGLSVLYPNLAKFCGDLLTVFPGTSTVESDFSIVNYEKDDRRTLLTDLCLEGILHCKQYESIQRLLTNIWKKLDGSEASEIVS